MEPKRTETIQGMPACDPLREPDEPISEERAALRRDSGLMRKEDQPHAKMLNRKSQPYRIVAPEHHDHVAVPDPGGVRRRRRRARLAAAEPEMREPERHEDPRRR